MLKLVERYRDRPREQWAPLFHRILEHRIRDHHRRGSVRHRVLSFFGFGAAEAGESPLEAFPAPSDGEPEALFAHSTQRAALRAALQRLPHRQRQVVLLREWEGFDVRTTAEVMGCSEGSVKTHYARAVAALRAALQEYA